jgi:hypothetical protein
LNLNYHIIYSYQIGIISNASPFSINQKFTHSLGCNIVNVGNIGNELSTYSCTRDIYIYIVCIYIIMKTCTKHDTGLEVLD